MTRSPRAAHVIVIGGGIFGCSAAVHLARLGAQVTLITDGAPANGASGRSLAWLNSARFRSAEYHRLRVAGLERYRLLAQRYPDAAWLRLDGGLTWDADTASNAIASVFAHEKDIGYPARWLSADQVAAVTPGIDKWAIPSQGAIFNPGEGWVDLPSLIDVLLGEFLKRGGRIIREAGLAAVETSGDRVKGVVRADGQRIGADAVLVAAGAAVPGFAAKVGRTIPDATPIGLLVRTKPTDLPLRAVLNTPRAAIRPALGGALAIDSAWSEKEVVTRSDGTYEARSSTVQGLLDEASAVLEGNPTLHLESYGMGPKPMPVNGEPVVGQLDGISGYYIAFSHSGATLGLIIGELLANEIVTGDLSPLLARFRPGRF